MSEGNSSLWTQLPQSSRAPCDRYKHACCSHDGHVYLLGGRDKGCLRDFWKYSVAYNEWTELTCTGEAAPEELEEHSMVAHQGFLYVFGGMLDSAYTKCRSALWVFDIAKQKWVHCRGKSSSPQVQMPSNRKAHSAVALGSAMLVYGGFVDIRGSSQEFWRLDFDTMAWAMLSGCQREASGPGPRHGHSATAHQGCMYLFGGLKGLWEQRDFWRWNSSSNAWSSLKNTWSVSRSGPQRLTGHSAVAYRDGLLLFGGGRSQIAPKNCLWRYSFRSQAWSEVAALPGSVPPAKINHCCAGLGPSYRCGGPGGGSTPSSGAGLQAKLLEGRARPFKNKCFPEPLTFLGSEGAIELKTLGSTEAGLDLDDDGVEPARGTGSPWGQSCLTFENRAFRKQWSCTEEEEEDELLDKVDGDIERHLPDVLLVLGGRPCAAHSPISVWQMTLNDS